MIKLYFCPRTRSTRPRWLLEELGVPYELVRVDLAKGEHKTPEYLAIHPHGAVPALVDGDTTIIESVAICMHLADRFPDKGLAPAFGSIERGRYYQWLVYAVATLEPVIVEYYSATAVAERDEARAKAAKDRFEEIAGVLEKALGANEHMLGGGFTTVDLVFGSMLGWARSMKLLEGHGRLEEYVKALTQRPAFRRAQS